MEVVNNGVYVIKLVLVNVVWQEVYTISLVIITENVNKHEALVAVVVVEVEDDFNDYVIMALHFHNCIPVIWYAVLNNLKLSYTYHKVKKIKILPRKRKVIATF